MSNITLIINKFHSGEISPMLEASIDSEIYQSSCRTITNYVINELGRLSKAPGSYFLGETKSNNIAYYAPFRSNSGEYFMFEFTNTVCRIWKEDGTLFQVTGSDLEIAIPYTEADLPSVKYFCDMSEMWLVSRGYAPQKISYSGTTFTLSTPTFTGTYTFASTGDYPGSICIYAGRMWFGGTDNNPGGVFGSRAVNAASGVTRYLDFTLGTNDDDAIFVQETELVGVDIQWIAVQKRLIVGTKKSVWISDGNPPTPSTFDLTLQTYNGSTEVQAQTADGICCYVGRAGLSLRATAYSQDAEGLVENNIAKRSSHMIENGVSSMGIQTLPFTTVWTGLGSGNLAGCAINVQENIIGWFRREIGGGGIIKSMAVLQKDDNDDIFLCVERTINSVTKRYVEVIHTVNPYGKDKSEDHQIDCGLRLTPGSSTVTGLSHLEGLEVDAIGDGAILPRKTVSSGQVTYDRSVNLIHIGLPYRALALMNRLEIPARGTSQGKVKKIEEATVRVCNTRGGSVGTSLKKLKPLLYERFGSITFGDTPDKFTGDISVSLSGQTNKDGDIYVVCDEPVEFNLLGIFPRVAITET